MKKTVKRIPFVISPKQTISVPFNSEIISLDVLNGEPGISVIAIDGEASKERTILILAIDKEIPPHLNRTKFIGTFQLPDRRGNVATGSMNVFFVFEE